MHIRLLPSLAAFALVLAAGLAQGLWTNRWTSSSALEGSLERLGRVPKVIGDWEGTDYELNPRQLEVGQIDGYLGREYRNRRDGRTVNILIVCGQPGPIAVHTPDICYAGLGWASDSPPVHERIPLGSPDETASFKTVEFQKEGAIIPEFLRIFWSWSDGGKWEAPDSPRSHFIASRALYKLYVICGDREEGVARSTATCREFICNLVPELNRALGPNTTMVSERRSDRPRRENSAVGSSSSAVVLHKTGGD